MKDFLDDILVWSIIIAVLAIAYFSIFRKTKSFMFILGLLLLLGAVPAGIMLEGSVNFSETRIWGVGYFLMVLMGVLGLIIMIRTTKKKNGSKLS